MVVYCLLPGLIVPVTFLLMMEVCHKVMIYKSGPRSDPSDLSKGFEADDILGVTQAIKGFDKSDFCEVISIYLKSTLLLGFIDLIKSKGGNI